MKNYIVRQGYKKVRADGTGSIRKDSGHLKISVNGKQVHAHRYLMEQHLGRKLGVDEVVHHLNHNKLDNRIENLIVTTRAEHKKKYHPEIGVKTRLKKIYQFDVRKVVELYEEFKNTIKVAEVLGCSEITVRRELISYFGKTLKEYRRERGWKYE